MFTQILTQYDCQFSQSDLRMESLAQRKTLTNAQTCIHQVMHCFCTDSITNQHLTRFHSLERRTQTSL